MNYEGPIYRPPSEADSLLVLATAGCPHNKCTFCMVYKKGPRYRARSVAEIKLDLLEAKQQSRRPVRSLFLPAGNTIAMATEDLAEVCRHARQLFPELERITVYGSSQYIVAKGIEGLRLLREAGLSRIHIGLESGDDEVLRRIKKGATRAQHIEAGRLLHQAGIEISEYVLLGIGGRERSRQHAVATAEAINAIAPQFLRLRTLVPKVGTPLLRQYERGEFDLLGPHEILQEIRWMLERIEVSTHILSDHYTNYINIEGHLPEDRSGLIQLLDRASGLGEEHFRPLFIGSQ